MTGASISIIVANDHPLIRAGLRDLLARNRRWKLIGIAETGAQVLKAIQRFKPDVAIIGSRISDPDTREIASVVGANFPRVALCLLAHDADLKQAPSATRQRGAEQHGRVMTVIHERSPEHLCEWLDEMAGPSIGKVPGAALPSPVTTIMRNRSDRRLTDRQAQIVSMLQIGMSNKEISNRLGLSEGTVKVHLHRLYRKMGVSNRTQLAAQSNSG